MKKILLDTNAYTAYLSGDTTTLSALAEADVVYMSVIVLGELYAGFAGGTKERKNKEILELFLSKPRVKELPVTHRTAELFGRVKHGLKKAGSPIPINDVWLAAHALEAEATLVTFDAHFQKIPSIKIWRV